MRFITESTARCAPRLGSLMDLERLPNLIFETPLLLIYTKQGSVPHLTKEVFKYLTSEHQCLAVSTVSAFRLGDSIKNGKCLSEFVGMKEYPFLLSVLDPAEENPNGDKKQDAIAVWTRQGRRWYSPETYMNLVEILKPDMYVALCDGDTNKDCGKSRISKAVKRSMTMFEECFKRHKSSEILQRKGIFAAVEGGYNLEARETSINFLLDKNPDGFVIDGLHDNSDKVQNIEFTSIENVIRRTMNLLPAEKMKISMGCWNPAVVLNLIENGVDVFDSTYPYRMTESSKALTFMCSLHEHDSSNSGRAISIADKCFAEDFSPICKSCECLTCKNHTKAYLNHLCHTKELLGPILLMIHNTHQYIEFFKSIRYHLKRNTFEDFKKLIVSQFPAQN